VPHEFAAARAELASHIDHWGPVASRAEYLDCLSRADVFVSTALHEFFGLAVMESIALGLFPLLPKRLSYPELLGLDRDPAAQSFFHDGTASHLARRLAELARAPNGLITPRQEQILAATTHTYLWSHRAAVMDAALVSSGGRGV
jgi:glycosyltransferase involved in cell wall biosynthesis